MNASEIKPEQLRIMKCLDRFQEADRQAFLPFLELVNCPQGTVLFEEGDAGDSMFLILEGEMRVFRRHKSQVEGLKRLVPGEAFGDIALFNQTPRLAGIDAAKDSRLLKLTAAQLEKFTAKHPDLSGKFLSSLTALLTQMYSDFK